MASSRLVLRLPPRLAEKIASVAEREDMLPTEWVREVLREAFEDEKKQHGEEVV